MVKDILVSLALLMIFLVTGPVLGGGYPTVVITDAPDGGLVMAPITESALRIVNNGFSDERFTPSVIAEDGSAVPSQYVDGRLLLMELTPEQVAESREKALIVFLAPNKEKDAPSQAAKAETEIAVSTPSYRIRHSADEAGGLPSRIEFVKTGGVLERVSWHDRLIDFDGSPETNPFYGSWTVNEGAANISICSDGPIAAVVRQETTLRKGADATPNGAASVYYWYYFKNQPGLVFVEHSRTQKTARKWRENHFLELHIADGSFPQWLGDARSGTFTGSKEVERFSHWGAMRDDAGDSIAFLSSQVGIYDGLHDYGPYMNAAIDTSWTPWDTLERRNSAWIVIDSFENPDALKDRCDNLARSLTSCAVSLRADRTKTAETWREKLASNLAFAGKLTDPAEYRAIQSASEAELRELGFELLTSGDLACLFRRNSEERANPRKEGVELLQAMNVKTEHFFLSNAPQPVYRIKYRVKQEDGTFLEKTSDSLSAERSALSTADGALELTAEPEPGVRAVLRFETKPETSEIAVTSEVQCGEDASVIEWTPLPISLDPAGQDVRLVVPGSAGTLLRRPGAQDVRYAADYPSGWCTAPWCAIYDEKLGGGLFFGVCDPSGMTKRVSVGGDAGMNSICVEYAHPAPDMTKPGNGVSVRALVLKAFQGDWFDAAVFYRDWVRKEASWYPRELLGPEGRTDVPQWFKEMNVWICDSGKEPALAEKIRKFRDAFGLPCAIHWYNWHMNPFDNDYPHYKPFDGFAETVADLQKDGDIHVMPYINGRIWDKRDRGLEDWQFTSIALPACSKNEDGTPVVERYGSKESDGSPVEFGVMCPSTQLWQDKVFENVHKLTFEEGVDGVYVDQIAAAAPALCMDASHGHPLGGGAWWISSYGKMLDRILSDVPDDRIITTECNAENYARYVDGLLTWHVQSNDMIPAFYVVYGGAVQTFGRAHSGCSPAAYRMKEAQALVWGEQLGWLSVDAALNEELLAYMRGAARFRSQIVPYFYKGEMARPAKFTDEIPECSERWNWGGSTQANTLPAVLTGSWRIMKQGDAKRPERAVVIFTNYSNEDVSSRVQIDPAELGFDPENVKLEKIDSEGTRTELPDGFLNNPIDFPARESWGVELTAK
ncbi:MAG: hypothetical protein II150_09545 [Thermoguttaceae bacterium]|nr:hypothetical protein [Thermoguttaceae bacterium]